MVVQFEGLFKLLVVEISEVVTVADELRSTHSIAVVAPQRPVYAGTFEFATGRHAQLAVHGESVASNRSLTSTLVLKVFPLHLLVQSISLCLDLEKFLVNLVGLEGF